MYEYNNNELRFWDGRMPFAQRVSIAAAQRQLVDALARARDRIDEEFGPRTWKWLDEPATSFARCQDGDDQGWEDSSRQGMTTGMSIAFFPPSAGDRRRRSGSSRIHTHSRCVRRGPLGEHLQCGTTAAMSASSIPATRLHSV